MLYFRDETKCSKGDKKRNKAIWTRETMVICEKPQADTLNLAGRNIC